MKKIVRNFSLFLVILMVATCFVACNRDKEDSENQNSTTVATTQKEGVSKLPDDIDWNGEEYVVLCQYDHEREIRSFEVEGKNSDKDIVDKAVWERNDAINKKYGLVIKENLATYPQAAFQDYRSSNSGDIDMVMYGVSNLIADTQAGYFVDLNTVKYIDFEHPSWDTYTNEQLKFGSAIYTVSSDFNLQNKEQYGRIYYNRDMVKSASGGYLEDLVKNNEWTLDKYSELVKAYAADTGDNGSKGDHDSDTFGVCGDRNAFLSYSVGAGYRASAIVNGKIELVGETNAMIAILENVGDFFFDAEATYITEEHTPLDYVRSNRLFEDERALFASNMPRSYLVEKCDFEYGVLPYPKNNAEQKDFYSSVDYLRTTLCAIPKIAADKDLAGFGLEVLAEYSTDTSYKVYLESISTVGDSFDSRAYEMYSIIFEHPIYDIAIIRDFGDLRRVVAEEITQAKNASFYEGKYSDKREAAQNAINEFMSDLGIE